MLAETLLDLAEWHHDLGLIGIDEFLERRRVALWLESGDPSLADPRQARGDPPTDERQGEEGVETLEGGAPGPAGDTRRHSDDPGILTFVWNGWVFTRQDPDPYPSTPHGHWQGANRPWPKLNPYVGRVFEAKHREDPRRRLGKRQMIELWRDPRFRTFCRDHVEWYDYAHPHHAFPVRHPFRFPKPWRRR